MEHNRWICVFILFFVLLGVNGCGVKTPLTTPTLTLTPTNASLPTATHLPTKTPTMAPSPTPTFPPVPTISVSQESSHSMLSVCQSAINGIYDLKKDIGLPDHLMEQNPFRLDTEFNPNSYFNVLPHLKMASGYKLDYIYFNDELGGLPLVYARKNNASPIKSYSDFLKSFGEEMQGERSYGVLQHRYDFLERVQIDKTPDSYFEFVTLAFLADQYYLWWHGLYNDLIVLCDAGNLQYVDAEMEMFELEFPQNIKDRIASINFQPVVIVDEKEVTVRFVTFTKWGGFFENVYVMDKDNPMLLLDVRFNPLIEYDCGISF